MATKPVESKNQRIPCPCKRKKCVRFGDCGACRAHHKRKDNLPYCERPAGRRKARASQEGAGDE